MWELSILGISHILFGIILIATKKRERSDNILILWLLILMMPFLQQFLSNFKGIPFSILRFNNQAITLLNGPLLYLYMREVTKRTGDHIRYWPHFILFLTLYIILIINPAPIQPGGPTTGAPTEGFALFRYFGMLNLISFILYALFTLQALNNHRKSVQETHAYKNGEITLLWLSLMPVLFLLFILIIFIIEISSLDNTLPSGAAHLIVFFCFTLYLIFFGLRQKKIHPEIVEPQKEPKSQTADPQKSGYLLNKIRSRMDEEQYYLNPTLSVYDLATSLDISRHQISSLLNEQLGMNFYQFINDYRLKEVCRRFEEDSENRFNILEHAYGAGFNSKSSFNSLFKNRYGLTPSQYKKQISHVSEELS